jgi:nanoRNase/pAp phosphatase (c-di-AMP/oligoRNAs hydrolase)
MSMSQEHLERLLGAVGEADQVLILPHNNPDPDAIASAVALQHLLAEKLGVTGHIAYQGLIGRAENKALVRFLGQPLYPFTQSDLRRLVPVALVDVQPGAGSITLPPESSVDIVIDRHEWCQATADASYADVRPELGATSTILTGYLQAAGIEPASPLATALFYGIKTNTMGLARNTSPADAAAYVYLRPRIEVGALAQIERAQVPAVYFRSFDIALRAARVYDGLVISYLGVMSYPDLAAEMADVLLRLEESRWVICLGVHHDVLFVSVRARGLGGGAGQLVQAIVGKEGTAGGHRTMAGGQVSLRSRNAEQVVQEISQRALQTLQIPPDRAGEPLI